MATKVEKAAKVSKTKSKSVAKTTEETAQTKSATKSKANTAQKAAKAKETKASKTSKSTTAKKSTATKAKTSKAAKEAAAEAKRRKMVAVCTVIGIALVLALCAAAGLGAFATDDAQNTAVADEEVSSASVSSETLEEEIERIKALITEAQISEWDYLAGDWLLSENSRSMTDAARLEATGGISDAVTFPFTSSSEDGMKEELIQEILLNPIFGIGFTSFVSGIQFGDVTLGDICPWMAEAVEANDTHGLAYWATEACDDEGEKILDDDGDSILVVNDRYKEIAVKLAALISLMEVQGIEQHTTTTNWSLLVELADNDRKLAKSVYEYEGDFIVLSWVAKSGDSLFEIGFNLLDKRFALFREVTVVATDDSATTTTTTDDGGGDDPDPGDDDPPSPTKNPSSGSDSQNNAEKNSGTNDNAGSGPTEEKGSSASGSSAGADSDAAGATAGSGTASEETDQPKTSVIDPAGATDGTNNESGENEDLTDSLNNSGETARPD